SIPHIGGKKLAHAQGALRHHHDAVKDTYGAGWFKINMGFDHMHLGIKTRFSGGVKNIGAKEQKAIVRQITQEEQDGSSSDYWCEINHHFTVDAIKPAAYFQNQLIVLDNSKFLNPWPFKKQVYIRTNSPSGLVDIKEILP